MEELSMDWPPAIFSLEPLRPLSPDVLEHNDIADLGNSVEKLSRSEKAGKLLDQLNELGKEAEPFDWFASEKSIDLPLFDNVPSPTYYKYPTNVRQFHNYAFQQPTDVKPIAPCMSQEFDYDQAQCGLYSPPMQAMPSPATTTVSPLMSPVMQPSIPMVNAVSPASSSDWVKSETLTPPESPKEEEEILKMLQEIQPDELEQLVMARKILQEIQPEELEQLVMNRVDDVPAAFSERSCSLDEFSDSVASPALGSESGMDDPEWSPPRSVRHNSGYSSTASSCASSVTRKRKSKPYSRPAPEERKQRKKEQNKNAATRYRLKKKAEVEEVRSEAQVLEEKNKELRNKLDDLNREVRYLKSLMREVYRKNGLI